MVGFFCPARFWRPTLILLFFVIVCAQSVPKLPDRAEGLVEGNPARWYQRLATDRVLETLEQSSNLSRCTVLERVRHQVEYVAWQFLATDSYLVGIPLDDA
jgi:hypothetical protein